MFKLFATVFMFYIINFTVCTLYIERMVNVFIRPTRIMLLLHDGNVVGMCHIECTLYLTMIFLTYLLFS